MAKKLARLKKTVKRSTRLKPVKTVRARRSRRQGAVKGPLVSAETLERAATAAVEDPVVALAAERKVRAEAEERLAQMRTQVSNVILALEATLMAKATV